MQKYEEMINTKKIDISNLENNKSVLSHLVQTFFTQENVLEHEIFLPFFYRMNSQSLFTLN